MESRTSSVCSNATTINEDDDTNEFNNINYEINFINYNYNFINTDIINIYDIDNLYN